MTNTMRVAIGQFNELTHERLTFAQQLGASGVLLNTPVMPTDQRWEQANLAWLRRRCDEYGLRLEALVEALHLRAVRLGVHILAVGALLVPALLAIPATRERP